PLIAVDNNCTLARSMPVEQEPSTSSGMGQPFRAGQKQGLDAAPAPMTSVSPKVTAAARRRNPRWVKQAKTEL
ncbi:hypothetical protein, partial [uncultured Roseobacter sp.]|uniref:hypothetical protein n=1 Tax=uncultured Roseobacter sp. TaxID=114847 RepID=UPI0026370274